MQVNDPGIEVTVYPVIAAPPFEVGAVHETTEDPVGFPDVIVVAVTDVGAFGPPTGVTGAVGTEGTLVPAGLVAVTVNV